MSTVLLAALIAVSLVNASAAPAQAPYILLGVYPAGIGTAPDYDTVEPIRQWQSKRHAVVNTYAPAGGEAILAAHLDRIRSELDAIPMVSYGPPVPNSATASGLNDGQLFALGQTLKRFLAGPDLTFGNADDRRVYLRYGYEANHDEMAWSPCSVHNAAAPEPSHFRNSWIRAHDLLVDTMAMDDTRLAWVFSTTQDPTTCVPVRDLYPGKAFVDWLGFDAYSPCNQTVEFVLGRMTAEYRQNSAFYGSKPIGINEAGVSSENGRVRKLQWISDYWSYLHTNDLRMSVWFNADLSDNAACAQREPWKIFGRAYTPGQPVYGDESFAHNGVSYRGFSAYRTAVADPAVIGTSPNANPRYLTNDQFLGR